MRDHLTPASLRAQPVECPVQMRPLLFVVIDTEEEFDWSHPLSRQNTSVQTIRQLAALARVLERFGVVPTYAVDYPVMAQEDGWRPIRELTAGGRGQVAAHLHPWVNPPLVEEVTPQNSYGCNLSPALEHEKIGRLLDAIECRMGARPRSYKAGRYGFGVSTAASIEALEFEIDLSINPTMDFTEDGGPSFKHFGAAPFFFGVERRLLEIPCTSGYAGLVRMRAAGLHDFASQPRLQRLHLVGLFARSGLVNKLRLSPEGHPFGEMRQLTRTLLRRGMRTFTLTLHSSSLTPGFTPYVQTSKDLAEFMTRIERYLEFFHTELGGTSSTPEAFKTWLERPTAAESTPAPVGVRT